jgi:signal recognition particle subunit SRP54
MFESLTDRLSGILDKLTRRGSLTDSDVAEAMREVRRALLEADVALEVVRDFTEKVREKAVGQEVVKSVTPGQMVVKIVHDELVAMLGADAEPIDLATQPPVPIMLVGLQGSGKTTTCAKIGYRLTQRDKKKVLMASLDVRRPAAQEQLRVLGEQTQVETLAIVPGQTPQQITRRALDAARLGGFDVVLLDTAGRTHIDDELMREATEVRDIANPHETLLVADSLTGQDAVNVAKAFDERIGITGIVLTRADGDARGGAALSMRAVTGKPIKLLGVGEKWDALEDFHPARVASRILGMGDVVSLVEKAAQTIDMEKAQAIAQKMRKGEFDLEDLGDQLKQMERIGGMSSMLGLLPGIGKVKKQLDAANLDDRVLKRQRAIISSMTPKERRNPKMLDGKRKRRIAAGSGT